MNPVIIAPTATIVHYPNYGLIVESTLAYATAGISGHILTYLPVRWDQGGRAEQDDPGEIGRIPQVNRAPVPQLTPV